MSLLEGALPLSPLRPQTLFVYPRGVELGESKSVLEAADIECRPAELSFPSAAAPGRRTVYMVDGERLEELGDRDAIDRALSIVNATGGTVIILSDPGDSDASWLAQNEHVGGWITRPIDPIALLASIRSAERTLDLRDNARDLIEESDQLLQIGVALSAERDIDALERLI
ncbi:MAG: hypothetical protein JO349_01975, partial [Candidatus Eremiobacteraeota bacterium]|nr:hypothetical protein [Candidatus Eremiobacteraeota bacterium]